MNDDKSSTLQYSQVDAARAVRGPYGTGRTQASPRTREGEGAAAGASNAGQPAHVDAQKPGVLRVPPARQNAPRHPGNRPAVRRSAGRQGGR